MAVIIEPKLSYQIMGILFKAHNKLGPTYKEKYYQRTVEEELRVLKIPYKKELCVEVGYDNKAIGKHFIDFLIANKILLETKAVGFIPDKYYDQVLSYLKTLKIRLGIIANFKGKKLFFKRIILPDKYL